MAIQLHCTVMGSCVCDLSLPHQLCLTACAPPHCIQVAVVEGGRVVESGTHEELLARPGSVYRALVERQLEHA
jgi:ABC-type dipeptide/oligopeptide/nickel transport system ATPase component